MSMIIMLIVPNTYSQIDYAATHVKFCDADEYGKEVCLEYFTLQKERIIVSTYTDSIVLSSNVDFLHNTYYIYQNTVKKSYDKNYKSTIFEFKSIDESGTFCDIFFSQSPIKSLNNKYLFIVRVESSVAIYLLNKL